MLLHQLSFFRLIIEGKGHESLVMKFYMFVWDITSPPGRCPSQVWFLKIGNFCFYLGLLSLHFCKLSKQLWSLMYHSKLQSRPTVMLPLVLSSSEIIFRKVWEENAGAGHRLGSPSFDYKRGDYTLGRWSTPRLGIFSLWFLCLFLPNLCLIRWRFETQMSPLCFPGPAVKKISSPSNFCLLGFSPGCEQCHCRFPWQRGECTGI